MKSAKVAGIILAAGNSQRMGENKLQLPIGNTTIGSASLATALNSRLDKVFVVVQEHASLHWITEDVERQKTRYQIVRSKQACKGQSYSIKAGIQEVQKYSFDGAMMLLADQPFLKPAIIDKIIHLFNSSSLDKSFIAARNADILHPPILFRSSLYQRLLTIRGDRGAKSILKDIQNEGYVIDFDDGKSFYDIDTKDDYQWAKRWQKQL
ncbi:NTP transferase domain-containing protein [Gracilibacillus sp. HCP3S3_G5_1]|uniref:NTP transferase domain-containing protein n=1 Tax=unclassified Gracilibacillus TaxID=2625209 RepID=UPI003F89CDA4